MCRVALVVIAKEPLPGKAKTRLSPPCTPSQARRSRKLPSWTRSTSWPARRHPPSARARRQPGRWRRPGLEVIPQRGVGLGERLAAAFEDVAEPALLVGMDTPQLTPRLLLDGMRALASPDVDAVLGRAVDGGYWTVGLKRRGS